MWMTKLKGYADGQPVQWQYRLTVRKADGTAAVAWEEWRDCAAHAAACKVGRFAGGGWSSPSRVLLAMDASKVIHGVSATGVMTLTPGPRGMTAVMLSAGQSPDLLLPTASADRVESSSRAAQSMQFDQWSSSYAVGMACTGCFVYTPS